MPIIGGRQASVRGLGFQGAGAPAQVTGLTATNVGSGRAFNNGRIDLAWTAPATNGAPITGYFIERSTNSGSTWSTLVANTGNTNVSYSDTSLLSAQRYDYRVSAINAVGTGLASTAANATATTVPQAPTIGTATAGSGSASITFTAGATGGSAITGYTMTSSPGSITGTGASSPITVSSLTDGTAYTFTVTATNANGTSAASSASNSVTPNSFYIANIYNTTSPYSQSSLAEATGYPSSGTLVGGRTRNASNQVAGCYLLPNASASSYLIQKRFTPEGSSPTGDFQGIGSDSSGNIYAAGSMTNTNNRSRFMAAKWNNAGTLQWQKALGFGTASTESGSASAIHVDSSGNVYVAGYMTITSETNFQRFAIAKYNSGGTLQWARTLGLVPNAGGNYSNATGISTDSSGNVYFVGTGRVGTESPAVVAGHIFKYNSSGTLQWQRRYDGFTNSYFNGCATNSSGDTYIVGNATNASSLNFPILLKVDTNGSLSWQKTYSSGSYGSPNFYSVSLDSSGNVYTFGADPSISSVTFGTIVKWDSSGNISFQRGLSVANSSGNPIGPSSITFAYGGGVNSDSISAASRISVQRDNGETFFWTYSEILAKLPLDGSKSGSNPLVNLYLTDPLFGNSSSYIVYFASSLSIANAPGSLSASSYTAGTNPSEVSVSMTESTATFSITRTLI